ncbi:ATP-binding protein [Streptomyces roseus]|uniref:ATP-binding protein n=1 Tax=Streptomyces TaxID=1883 RepID=UPI0033C2C94F
MLTTGRYDDPADLFTPLPHFADPAAHFLPLPGLRALVTPGLRDTARVIAAGVAERAMVCLHGAAGVGKTFAVRAVLDGWAPDRSCRLTLRSRPGPADLRAALHHALHLPGAGPADPAAHDVLITAALARRSPVVVVDEAHQLSPACFEYLRYLYDAVGGVCLVLITGQGGERVLHGVRMLASRCAAWAQITPLRPEHVPVAVPRLHPIWHKVPAELLLSVDARFAHGGLRAWAALTHHASRMLGTPGAVPLEELLEQIMPRLGPVS